MDRLFETRFNNGYHDAFRGQLMNLAYERCAIRTYSTLDSIIIKNNELTILTDSFELLIIPLKNGNHFNKCSVIYKDHLIKNLFLLVEFIYDFLDYSFSWDMEQLIGIGA